MELFADAAPDWVGNFAQNVCFYVCLQTGDVLLTYENEVVLTNEVYGDKALPYLVPTRNIRIECPLSTVDRVVEVKASPVRKAADEFCRFLFRDAAQQEFAKVGFRPNAAVSKTAAQSTKGAPCP